ncbi:MAG: hypothetical protein KAS16_05960 [Thermoplasmata archaeon]|nr:hypothetical protein [Thermoplasmata archaeon]
MGNYTNKRIGASIVIIAMLMASLSSLVGMGLAADDTQQLPGTSEKSFKANVIPLDMDKVAIQGSAEMVGNMGQFRDDRITAAPEQPVTTASLFPAVDTERTVLLEIGSGIDNGSFVPSYLYAGNMAANTYTRNEVVIMELNSWYDNTFINPLYYGVTDHEYSPGSNMWLVGAASDPACDAGFREYWGPPQGLDNFPILLNSDTTGDDYDLVKAGSFAIDGGAGGAISGEEEPFYADCDSTSDARWDDAALGLGTTCMEPLINDRLLNPSDFTMTLNGSYAAGTEDGNITLQISAIGNLQDLGYDSSKYMVAFFIVDDYDVVETRNNAYRHTGGGAGDTTYVDKDYHIRYSLQQWVGLDDALDGFLVDRGESVFYQDVGFARNPADKAPILGGAPRPAWTQSELGVVAYIYDEDTMEVHQSVYYDFEDVGPDLAIQASDVFSSGQAVNESVWTGATTGMTFNCGYTNILDYNFWVDEGGFWWELNPWLDPTTPVDPVTGDVNIDGWDLWDGCTVYAWLNYSVAPNDGDTVPLDITIENAGNGASGANVIVGIYDGDPTSGGALIDTHDAGPMAAGSSYNFIYNWDTTGYAGYNALCIIPDHLDVIAESNENNNIAPYDMYVAPPDDVGALSIDSLVDGATYEWGYRDIDATVGNMGTTTQAPFDVKCEINHLGSTVFVLNDDVESGALPEWTPELSWQIGADGHSGVASWEFPPYAGITPQEEILEYGPFDLSGPYVSAEWKWWHQYGWEAPSYDGGIVEASADGAAWTQLTPTAGYGGVLDTAYNNPLGGLDAYVDDSGGWIEDSCDLSAYVGDATVWIRYHVGTDDYDGGAAQTGWDIDDIRISKTTAGLGSLFLDVKPNTLTLAQLETEPISWNYNFADQAQYEISVMTMLPGDAVATNNETIVTINTVNSLPPAPPTDMATMPGGGSTTMYQQTTGETAIENNGVTNDHTSTHMPADAVTEDITENLVSAGGWTRLFTETFSQATDAGWQGDDNDPDADASDEWWDVAEAAADLPDIQVGDYAGVATPNALFFTDCDDDWAGQWAVAHYNNGNNWFDLSTVTDGYINLSAYVDVDANEGWRMEVTRNSGGAWIQVYAEENTVQAWHTVSYQLVAADLVNGFAFRLNCAGSGTQDDIAFDDITLEASFPVTSAYSLEHQWTFEDVTSATTHMFYATVGYAGDDNFAYYYSTTGAFAGEEVLMFTDTTPGLDQLSYDLGAGYTGPFYVAVRDTDLADSTTADIVSIDEMYVDSTTTTSADDLIITWTLSADDGAGANDVTGYDIYRANEVAGLWYEGPYIYIGSAGAGEAQYVDAGEMLAPGNSWYYVVATDGLYDSIPSSLIVSKFDASPNTTDAKTDGITTLSIPAGTPNIVLTANVSDNTTTDGNLVFLTGAEYFEGVDPGVGLGTAIALPDDAAWDGPYEGVTATVDTSGWMPGVYVISVRGNSPSGWGTVTTVSVTVTGPEFLIPVIAGWNFISTPFIPADTSIPNIFTDLDGDTTWTRMLSYDATDTVNHWKGYNPDYGGTQSLTNVDETMGVWIFIDTVGDGFIRVTGASTSGGGIAVQAGWNIIGWATTEDGTYSLLDLKLANLGVDILKVERFDPAQPYDMIEMLNGEFFYQGQAYWVIVANGGVLVIP